MEENWLIAFAIIMTLLLIGIAIHDFAEQPEIQTIEVPTPVVVTETVTEYIEVPSECAECPVCPEIDSEVLEEEQVKDDIDDLLSATLSDEDVIEDEVQPFLAEEYCWGSSISDEDDVLEYDLEELNVDWDVDDEEGNFEAEVEFKFYCDDNREDYIVRDTLISGEFDEDDLEEWLEDEEIDSFELSDIE